MIDAPTPPILVIYTEETAPDVQCRDTPRDAERSMESFEAEKGFYTVFHSEGRLARLATERWQTRIVGGDEPTPERLRPLLEAYLNAEGEGGVSGSLSVAALVEAAARIAPEREQARLRPRWLARLMEARSKRRR